MIQRSQMLHLRSLCVNDLAGMGSAMANSGSARLANVLRYASMGFCCTTCKGDAARQYISKQGLEQPPTTTACDR